MLPAAAALVLATSDNLVMALVEATPADAVGADGRTPLHHAAAFARSAALARRLLAFEPAWAKRVDAGGKSAFELLPSTASEEQATVLFEACGGNPRPVWVMLDPATAAWSAAEARAALEADPDAAARPFAAPEGWAPTKGALVRLRPGLDEMKGLRAGEVAVVTGVNDYGVCVKRLRDGKPEGGEIGLFSVADLVHGCGAEAPAGDLVFSRGMLQGSAGPEQLGRAPGRCAPRWRNATAARAPRQVGACSAYLQCT